MAWVWNRLRGLAPAQALERIDTALDLLQRALTIPEIPVTVPYSAAMTPDAGQAVRRVFQITVTNGVAFAIARPLQGAAGAIVSFDVLNSSGGVMGAATWAAEYVFTKGAWAAPANGVHATRTFYKVGSAAAALWIEL